MNPTQPAKLFWLLLLAAFWAFYGLTGRDAWKADEALALAPILEARTDLSLAWGAPAPLHVAAATLLAKFAAPWLDLQDGARLASGVFTLAALLFTALAARRLFGPGFAATAVLALIGCLGLMLRMHALAPETALLAVWSALLAGVALGRDASRSGGVLIGLALSALFLGLRGLPDLVAGLALVLLPLASPEWRRPAYRRALALGLGLAVTLSAATLLTLHAGGLFEAWSRWHGVQHMATVATSFRAFSELPWLAWPLWPLALAALWHEHRRLGRAWELHLPVLALLAALFATLWPSWTRDGGLLPLLPPLALLAAHGVDSMKRGAAQAFYWFGVLCFMFFIIAFWTYFAALEWGMPSRLAAHVARLTPGYQVGSVTSAGVLLAAVATALWLLAIPLFPRAKIRPVLVWGSGMVLVWTLLIALFRPWMEAGWAYRPVIEDLRAHLPAGACLNVDADPAMRAMLRYHLGAHRTLVVDSENRPRRDQFLPDSPPHSTAMGQESGEKWTAAVDLQPTIPKSDGLLAARHDADCPWLLVAADRELDAENPPVWEGARPRLKRQGYRLHQLPR